jgi:hypothetical protein
MAVTDVADVLGRRRLTAVSVAVTFSVTAASPSAASGLASSISAVSPSSFVEALKSSGLSACTGVAVSAPVVTAPPALNVSAINVTDVADSLLNLDVEAANAQQQTYLSALNALVQDELNSTTAGNLSTVTAASTASLVLAVVDATATLSVELQDTALSILAVVAAAPLNASSGTAQSITSALSAVASSAVTSNPAALAAVQSVLDRDPCPNPWIAKRDSLLRSHLSELGLKRSGAGVFRSKLNSRRNPVPGSRSVGQRNSKSEPSPRWQTELSAPRAAGLTAGERAPR